ncbi:MAG: FkbM family methyltransferase [Bacteroidia bacterium]|nr:FkbM family methyltransferase [Bacteroidia bacterium]
MSFDILKNSIKKFISLLGYEVRNANYYVKRNAFNTQFEILSKYNSSESRIILDIGAFDGKTAIAYHKLFPNAIIYSFEPYSLSYNQLTNAVKGYKNIKTFKNAIAEKSGKLNLNINNSFATNSLLSSNKTDSEIDNLITTEGSELVDVVCIDEFAENQKLNKIDVLKLDIQGGELAALKGAIKMLEKQSISLIYVEVEFIEIYKNQPLFHTIVEYLASYKYKLFNIYNMHNNNNGQLLWADAIFISEKVEQEIKSKELFL